MDAAALYPALWLEPRWNAVPKQNTAEEQFRYALLQAPPDEWVPAFLAVIGYFPHSHELSSKAYSQLARIWYRAATCARSRRWKPSCRSGKTRKSAIKTSSMPCASPSSSRKATWRAVVQGMKTLTRDDVPDTFDPALWN